MSISSKIKLQQVLKEHNELMVTYEKILESVESKGIFQKYEFTQKNPIQLLRDKKVDLYEKFQLLMFSMSFYFDLVTSLNTFRFFWSLIRRKPLSGIPDKLIFKKKVFRFFLRFFIQSHVRRQLDKLYKLYVRKLASQNNENIDPEVIDSLRKISRDVKDYASTLPSTKRAFSPSIGIASILVAITQFQELRTFLEQSPLVSYVTIILVAIPIIAFFVLTSPLSIAFRVKRTLFLDTSSYYHYIDVYLGETEQLYHGSVYEKENKLYESLDSLSQKPREMPVDKIISIIAGIGLFSALAWLLIIAIQGAIDKNEIVSLPGAVIGVSVVLVMFAFWLFVIPAIEYHRNSKFNLV